MPKLLTPAQAAELLGVKECTLEKWRTTKRYPLAYVKVGRNVRYAQEDVQAFIEANTQRA